MIVAFGVVFFLLHFGHNNTGFINTLTLRFGEKHDIFENLRFFYKPDISASGCDKGLLAEHSGGVELIPESRIAFNITVIEYIGD